MLPKLILTKDGSHSIEWAEGVTYHSTFGAVQESRHVFIREGALLVTYCSKGEVRRTLQGVGFRVEKVPGRAGMARRLSVGRCDGRTAAIRQRNS